MEIVRRDVGKEVEYVISKFPVLFMGEDERVPFANEGGVAVQSELG